MDTYADAEGPETWSNLTLSVLRRAVDYLRDSVQPVGFKALEPVQNNDFVWSTREQGTQRFEVIPEHFTVIVDGELGKRP